VWQRGVDVLSGHNSDPKQRRPLCPTQRRKLTAFVSAASPRSQKSESRVFHAFAWTNADARTELNGDEREPRNTAGVVTESFRAKRQPSVASRYLPSKLRPVRRAHTCLTKTAREPYPTSGRTSSRVACQSDRSPGGGHWRTMAQETSADERNQYGHTSCDIATT